MPAEKDLCVGQTARQVLGVFDGSNLDVMRGLDAFAIFVRQRPSDLLQLKIGDDLHARSRRVSAAAGSRRPIQPMWRKYANITMAIAIIRPQTIGYAMGACSSGMLSK